MVGQNHYNSASPLNFDYPKVDHLRGSRYGGQYSTAGSQYMSYPKFKQKETIRKNNLRTNSASSSNNSKASEAQIQLSKDLEKEIEELKALTKKAKELALKKKNKSNNNRSNSNNSMFNNQQQSFIELRSSGNKKNIMKSNNRHRNTSNLDKVYK